MADNWSALEVEAAVADYFSMLRLELAGERYNKSQHRRVLMAHLDNRSHGSVELKHQNISAVLIEMGIPYIAGYKPRANYQRSLLPAAVSAYFSENPRVQQFLARHCDEKPAVPSVEDILQAWVEPPVADGPKSMIASEALSQYQPSKVDYLEREARNQYLGEAGELFAINFERARLMRAGKDSLADRIEQVSETLGPSAGFDVKSFEDDGSDRFIEAKTTKYGKHAPFFITPNELQFSRDNAANYHLYRVFQFGKSPRLFTLSGDVENRCRLRPSEFIAQVAPSIRLA